MEKKLFLFSTESRYGVGGNLASLIKYLKASKGEIRLVGAASGYKNGNLKIATAENIQFHVINPDEDSEYEVIFKKYLHTRFLFWDWHLIVPPSLYSKYPIFLLGPGPLDKFRNIYGPSVYTEAWRLAIASGKSQIALFDLRHNGKKLWDKKINLKEKDKRKAVNARMHHHMRVSLPLVLESIFSIDS